MPENQDARRERLVQRLRELQARTHIQEQPFASDKPYVGRFIVFLREKWNSVAAKWYVRPLLRQQNLYNQAVTQTIQEFIEMQTERLDELEQRVMGGEDDVTLLTRTSAEGEYRAGQWRKQMTQEWADLVGRLSRLEEMLAAMNSEGGDESDRG
jgi:hypothetical protein